jgi:hypothetical protein
VVLPCSAGGYYALFSGDGMTYSSLGGLLTPLGTEYISSPFYMGALQPSGVASIALCLSGSGGGRPSKAGACPLPQSATTSSSSSGGNGGGSGAAQGRRLLWRRAWS